MVSIKKCLEKENKKRNKKDEDEKHSNNNVWRVLSIKQCTHTYTHTHARTHALTHTYTHTHARAHWSTHTHTHTHTEGAETSSGEPGARSLEAESVRSSARGCVKLKIVTKITRSSAPATFIAESVYLVLNSLLDWIFTCWCTSHGLLYVYIIIYSTLHLLPVPCVDAWRWHVWPWLSEFSGVAVSCFTLSRSTIFPMYRS